MIIYWTCSCKVLLYNGIHQTYITIHHNNVYYIFTLYLYTFCFTKISLYIIYLCMVILRILKLIIFKYLVILIVKSLKSSKHTLYNILCIMPWVCIYVTLYQLCQYLVVTLINSHYSPRAVQSFNDVPILYT